MISELIGKYVRVKAYDRIHDTNFYHGVLSNSDGVWLKLEDKTFDGENTIERYTYIPIVNVITVNQILDN